MRICVCTGQALIYERDKGALVAVRRKISIRIGRMWICFLVAAALLTTGFGLNAALSVRVLSQNADYRLMEILENRRVAVQANIESHMLNLTACAQSICEQEGSLEELAARYPALLQEMTGAQKVALVDMSGAGRNTDGEAVDLSGSDIYTRIAQGEESAVAIGESKEDGQTYFKMAVAVERGGEREFILVAYYRIEDICEYLLRSSGAVNDACLLIDRQGNVLMRTERTESWDNLIDRIEYDDEGNGENARMLASLIEKEDQGSVTYTYYGEKWYCAFAELGLNDWLLAYRVQAVELEYVQGALMAYNWALYAVLLAVLIWIAAMYGLRDERIRRDRRIEDLNRRASRECLRILAGHPGAILCDTDLRTNKTYLYGSFMSVLGRDPVLTNYPYDAVRVGMISDEDAARIVEAVDRSKRGHEHVQTDITLRNADGSERACRLRVYVMRDENGELFRVISRIVEIGQSAARPEGEQMDAENLISRHAAQADMDEKIKAMPCALMLLDIDNSSRLAEKFGAEESEKVMRRIIEELTRRAPADEQIARLGGDEFALLIPHEMDENALREISARIQSCVAAIGDEFDTPLTASVGSAVSPKDGTSFDELYFKADTAQYMAKQSGRKKLLIYRED